jgi:hypothetical protein
VVGKPEVKRSFVISSVQGIFLSRLTPYAEEIIGDHECGF